MKKNKDNPVPSLDDLFKEFSHSNREQGIFSYNEFLKSKLQNGVETNNGQPRIIVPNHLKLIKCTCLIPTKTMIKGKEYEGYIEEHSQGWFYNNKPLTLFHFINEKGIHRTCGMSRLMR